jgi:hypothetical protein
MVDKLFTSFSDEEIEAFRPALKIGLISSITPEGLPHITLFSSLMACDDNQLSWGQFVEGISFNFIENNPSVGWLIMSLNKEVWRGKASYTHAQKSGKEFDFYNNTPMFRYNAYFGIHTVYYMNLINHSGKEKLPMGKIVFSAVKTRLSKAFFHNGKMRILNNWTSKLLNKIDSLKFLSYVNEEGFPEIIPLIQAQSDNKEYIIFALGAYTDEIKNIPSNTSVAVFCMSLDMTDVLVRGEYKGIKWIGPSKCGQVKINYVYNPMPPVMGRIYPKEPISPIKTFK